MSRDLAQFEKHPASFAAAGALGVHRAVCVHVVDGDTIELIIDLGWRMYTYAPIRLLGIDAAETRGTSGSTRKLALAAKSRIESLALDQPVLLRSFKGRETFGRFLGDVYVAHEAGDRLHQVAGTWRKVQEILIEEGLAAPA